MAVFTEQFNVSTKEDTDVIDLTSKIRNLLAKSRLKDGLVTVHSVRSVCAVTTIEYEPGCVQDIKDLAEKLVPRAENYEHQKRWHDNNGHSHMRSALFGPSLSVPFMDGRLCMEPWQQIVFVDFQPAASNWEVAVVFMGE